MFDLDIEPTAVKVMFIPDATTKLTTKEHDKLTAFANNFDLIYEIDRRGRMVWKSK